MKRNDPDQTGGKDPPLSEELQELIQSLPYADELKDRRGHGWDHF